jgi:murein DD-endopeptidase MepM/ murein hydrolase activator NlpD
MAKFDLFYPVKPARINQAFGAINPMYKENGIDIVGHNGIDFAAVHGQPVYAAHDGTCYPEVDNRGGNGVVLRSNVPFNYLGEQVYMKSIYWHFINAYAVVKWGQFVKAGDVIGYADSTGLSTGDHLHFGLKPQAYNENDFTWYNVEQKNGYLGAIDPAPFFNKFYADDATKVFSLYNSIIALLKSMLK